jgi:hypothetical protein
MSSVNREQLLLMISKLFKLSIEEIQQLLMIDIHIFKKTLLSQLLKTSKTINYLAKNLDEGTDRTVSADRTVAIRPRTKDEVEALMDEIRPFI